MVHIPVLLGEVIKYLDPKPNQNFVDCTLGEGGHTKAILERIAPYGKVLGIDLDREAEERVKLLITNYQLQKIIFVCDNFAHLKNIIKRYKFSPVHGILLDLGLSSYLLEKSGRGFSFLKDEPLIMNYGQPTTNNQSASAKSYGGSTEALSEGGQPTARDIINRYPERELIRIFKEYGEERYAKRIAFEIVRVRKKEKIETTSELVKVILSAVPESYKHRRLHPATKIFQALRIAVNNELENFKKVLPQAIDVLKPKGRIVVISYQSLEDRITKRYFIQKSKENILKILTKKPIVSTYKEIIRNPRSRSAKLRAAEKSQLTTNN